MRIPLLVTLAALVWTSVGAAPMPPPPPGAMEKADRIAAPPSAEQVEAYAALFSPDVVAYENEKEVARGKTQWLAYVRDHVGLHILKLKISYGNPILVVWSVNNITWGPNSVQDCCIWAEVASYHLGADGRVDSVRLLRSGSSWGPPERPE